MKNKIITLFLIFLFPLVICNLNGAFKENIWTARSGAVGGAFTSVSNDVSAMIFNPAGLSRIEKREANFTYTQKFLNLPNVNINNMAALFGYPVEKIGAFGLGYLSSNTSDLYTEQSITLSYSAPLHKMLGTRVVKVGKKVKEFSTISFPLHAGLNLKFLSIGYNLDETTKKTNDPVFKDAQSKSGLAADLGFLVRPSEKISAALTLKNLLSPDIGLKSSEPVPMEVVIGGGYNFESIGVVEDLSVSLDLVNRMPKDATSEFNWRLGAESWFGYHRYSARFGLNNTEIALGGGIVFEQIESIDIQIDYSFTLPLYLSDNIGSHRLSLSTRF